MLPIIAKDLSQVSQDSNVQVYSRGVCQYNVTSLLGVASRKGSETLLVSLVLSCSLSEKQPFFKLKSFLVNSNVASYTYNDIFVTSLITGWIFDE